jgi:hypothetical protein
MTEKKETMNEASQLSAVSLSLEHLSTQKIFEDSSIEDAARYTRECAAIQNSGAVLKHGYRRRFGKLIGDVEEKEGEKARKKILRELQVPNPEFRRASNESAVPPEDYQRFIDGIAKKSKEITDTGVLRAGKKNIKSKHFSVATRIAQKLSQWLDSKLILSLGKDYSGTPDEVMETVIILEKLSSQFATTAASVRGKLCY